MKIDRSKLRKAQSELPLSCQQLIQKLKDASDEEMAEILKGIQTWHFGKCELLHWIDILDKFDTVLASVSKHAEGSEWILVYDQLHLKDKEQAKKYKDTISHILKFTGLLVEHSYARHIYSSMEHLIALLSASDMEVVLCVLNVLYIFSKRSNFISRLPVEQRKTLHQRLYCLAESWGGVENGFGLAHCAKDILPEEFPESASNVHFEFYSDGKKEDEKNKMTDVMTLDETCALIVVHLEGVNKLTESPGEIMEKVLKKHKIPEEKRIKLFSRIRLAKHFHFYAKRIKCLQARLQAISILVYSTSNQENTVNQLLYPGFVEEIVDAIRLNDPNSRYADISSASLRTLTAIIHLERNSRLNSIIEATGANSYHGFLPTLVRNCIQAMTDSKMTSYSHGFATALFSFLYHLASYESGGEALVSCGLMESLLKVIEWPGEEDCITFVTRAVRVVDLITNLDMAGFTNHGGLTTVLNRLEREIKLCQPYHGGILSSETTVASPAESSGSTEAMETSPPAAPAPRESNQASGSSSGEALMDTDGTVVASGSTSTSEAHTSAMDVDDVKACTGDGTNSPPDFTKHSKSQIIPQRAALLKSILNFFKKAILDPSFSDSVRTVMDGSLPTSLKYVISNVEYYGPALYLLATDVVTVYVFHEPSLLSSLQDKDLTGVVLKSLVVKDIPATREVLAFLPNILSALCLNNRGLQAFMACKPFDKLFKVLLSPDYLPAMRRRRSSDALGDTASSLGTAMDELMRHQPMLKTDAMKAIIKLLQEVCEIGSDPKVTCVKTSKNDSSPLGQAAGHEDEPVSDEEEYDEDRLPVCKPEAKVKLQEEHDSSESVADKKKFVPLTDYILNVVKFVDAILSHNSTDDHCREFVRQNGLEPLIKILGLPNLPLDFPSSSACQAIGTVGRSILVLCQEHQLLQQGLEHLTETLKILEPLNNSLTQSGQSLLLQEVIKCPKPFIAMNSSQQTPLLHAMAATQSYVNMFTYICRAGQNDVRTVCINHWGAELGIETLKKLCHLYSALVWESSVLLVLCTQEKLSDECELLKKDLQKLSELLEADNESAVSDNQPSSSDEPSTSSDSEKSKTKSSAKLRLLKKLLAASSKLGRALAEFFSLLVRLAVGSGQRQRRPQHVVVPSMPTLPARLIASQLAKLLMHGLSWKEPEKCLLPRLNLTFYICSLGFVHPMLFDDRKNPYHLMLQQLVSSGGHRALFDRFQWVMNRVGEQASVEGESSSSSETVPQSSDEFVNAWLVLMEKLVNPKLITDSPHSFIAGEGAAFKPRVFLMSTQSRAFSAVMSLWDHKPAKTYGAHMKQSLLAILCHIIEGEKMMKAHEKANKGETSATSGSTTAPPSGPAAAEPQDVNEEHLQQLVDMGFTRQHARNALLNTATIEQATEYVLTRTPAPTPGNQQLGLTIEMSEEDQMMQAIALSLGESFPMAVDQPPAAATEEPKPKPDENVDDEQTTSDKVEEQEETLDSSVIDNFAANMLPGCLAVVSEIPEAVYKACDLIVAISGRNGKDWRDRVIGEILSKIHEATGILCTLYEAVDCKNENAVGQVAELCEKPEAGLLKSMLHFLSLVLEEMKSACAYLIMDSGILETLIKLLRVVQRCLIDLKIAGVSPTTPSWMTPLLILVDLYERSVEAHLRKLTHDKCTGSVWKWFDDRSGRWHNYSNGNNNTIATAYRAGESSIRFTAGRRRYVVHFDTMIQVNEDSANRRPVMLEVITSSAPAAATAPAAVAAGVAAAATATASEKDKVGGEEKKATNSGEATTPSVKPSTEEVSHEETIPLLPLQHEQKEFLVRSCVSLVAIPVESSTLNAVVRLCVRLTRDTRLAQVFVDSGGPHHILELKRSSLFEGFALLITLLLRHVVEDQETLRHTMEKVIRSAAVNGIGSMTSGVGSNSLGTKEINYILRVLSPAATRQPELFKEILRKSLRYSLPAQIRRGGPLGNEITIPPNQAVLVNTVPVDKPPKLPKVSESVRSVVYELLHSLCRDPEASKPPESVASVTQEVACDSQASSQGPSQSQVGRTLGELGDLLDGRPTPSLVRHLTGESLPSEDIEDMIIDGESSSSQSSSKENKDKSKESGDKEKLDNESKPLLNKNTVLGILSELVKSYSGVAQLIAEFEIQKPVKQVKSQMPILAFVMDYLLPVDQSKESSDTSHRARLLLTVIAACSHSPDAQALLVNELKDSLARALAMPESQLKHIRLQALFQLVLGIIDSNSSAHQPNGNTAAQQNNTVKLFVKKGVVSDLARVSQHLDLSSPNVVATINCLLKPLEKLSNIVNLPPPANPSTVRNEKKEGTQDATSNIVGETRAENPTRVATPLGGSENVTGTAATDDQECHCMAGDLDSGLHIEGRAVRREPEDSYMVGSEEAENESRNTAESSNVTGQSEMDSEHVAESDDEGPLTSPSLDAVVIEIHREVSNESSVDHAGDEGNDEDPSGIDVEVDDHDEDDEEDDDEEDEEEDEEDVDEDEDDEDHRSDGKRVFYTSD